MENPNQNEFSWNFLKIKIFKITARGATNPLNNKQEKNNKQNNCY